MKLRTSLIWLIALAILLFVNYSIYQNEQLIRNGTPIFVELGRRDPRSLMQGDYMALAYRLAQDVDTADWPKRGQLVVKRSTTGVATFVRLQEPAIPLAADEQLLNYHKSDFGIDIAAPSFFFQEGDADLYVNARYGELRVAPNGASLLVALRDEELQLLGKPLY